MNIQLLRDRLEDDEAGCWEQIQHLRAEVEKNDMQMVLEAEVLSEDLGEPIEFTTNYLYDALSLLQDSGYSFDDMDPGHGPGHLLRDYVNALRLFGQATEPLLGVRIGILAGVMHDLACALIYRYDDPKRAVRHAEVGAILFLEIAEELPLPTQIKNVVAYAIAAHTHYLSESEVQCTDGIVRKITPYIDTYSNGEPVMSMWIPRWIDRLDLCGPTNIARHFLTLGRDHHDFVNGLGFKPTKFEAQMRPLLRSPEEIEQDPDGPTLIEHIRMLVVSQNDQSPYGKFDHTYPRMVELRNQNTNMVLPLLNVFAKFSARIDFSKRSEQLVLEDWEHLLGETIEPSRLGKENARELCERVRALPDDARFPMLLLFDLTIQAYMDWASQAHLDTLQVDYPNVLPGITANVQRAIQPFPEELAEA